MIAYFDLFSGISGDMTLGAFIDLGVPLEWLKKSLSDIPLHGFNIRTESVWYNGIRGVNLFVDAEDHVHAKDYREIKRLISDSLLSDRVKAQSLEAFEKIAIAESKIHGSDLETVHFHEVGGIDALVDIVGSFLCAEYLEIKEVYASVVPLGHGWVKCSHGTIPVPVPATLAILKGVPVRDAGIEMELVTPTGAAILTTLAKSFGSMPDMVIKGIGYGAGKNKPKPGSRSESVTVSKHERKHEHKHEHGHKHGNGHDHEHRSKPESKGSLPNLLRVVTGSAPVQGEIKNISKEKVFVIETSIDDMTPEIAGFIMEKLFDKGALDVCYIPVHMKKNRPGTRLEVLCRKDLLDQLVRLILSESSSLGVRFHEVERAFLERREVFVNTSFGKLQVKEIIRPDGSACLTPEYEVCRKLAIEKGLPLVNVYTQLLLDMNPGRI